MHFRSITVALRLLVAMPPKVKSLEAMALVADVEETQATQPADQLTPNLTRPEDPNAGPSLEAPKPAVKNGKSKKLRPTIATTLAVETVDVR